MKKTMMAIDLFNFTKTEAVGTFGFLQVAKADDSFREQITLISSNIFVVEKCFSLPFFRNYSFTHPATSF